ncbi:MULTISPECIES: hypothetical protein [Rhizobium]|uniref:DUF1849 family protein n=1 Tax=Rhizobium indicum TaxID=2583231 RepID=A0ABX6PS69_9HYPH|nr:MULTISPECIES: hypothetical protein [Rhizobium]NNU67788.1 hypothetical protein [Rhizobium sp. WYCCWR 11152]QKK21520.1 hypothetical protein FFM53_034630 [Rhizobium indicum]QKK34458.1 hypothetical protein FE844_033345 [Rhizobium indicum]
MFKAHHLDVALVLAALAAPIMSMLPMPTAAEAAETFSGSNTDIRTILAYKASDAALRKFVPEGWELSTFKEGPSAGANLQVEFVDQLFAVGADGKVGAPYRYVLFGFPIHHKGSDQDVLMLFDGLSRGGAGPYGIAEQATDNVYRSVQYSSAPTMVKEAWTFEGGGEMVSLETEFERGPLNAEKAESHVYSQLKPSFSRIYRYNEAADVVQAAGSKSDRLHSYTFKATGGKLATVFDGSESLISVTSLPAYSRDIFVPTP